MGAQGHTAIPLTSCMSAPLLCKIMHKLRSIKPRPSGSANTFTYEINHANLSKNAHCSVRQLHAELNRCEHLQILKTFAHVQPSHSSKNSSELNPNIRRSAVHNIAQNLRQKSSFSCRRSMRKFKVGSSKRDATARIDRSIILDQQCLRESLNPLHFPAPTNALIAVTSSAASNGLAI